MEVSAYIMRAGAGVVYRGYQVKVDRSALKGQFMYPIGGGIGVYCVEDAVIWGETLNRAVYDSNGNFRTVLAGNLAAVRFDRGEIAELRGEDIHFIEETLKPIERIAYGKVFLKEADALPEWQEK